MGLRNSMILLGILFLGLGILGTVDLPRHLPRLPVELGGESGLRIEGILENPEADSAGLVRGDRLVSLEGHPLSDGAFLRFLLDGRRVGEPVQLEVRRSGEGPERTLKAWAVLVPSLGTGLLVINFLVSLCVWAFGMVILLKGAVIRDVLLPFFQAMSLAVVMFVYWPENTLGLPFGDRISWFLSSGLYPFTVAFLLHFALQFPERMGPWSRRLVPLLYLAPLGVAGWLIWSVARARASLDPGDFASYQQAFQVFRLYLACYFVASPLLWAVKYVRTRSYAARQRIKWLFWGFTMGIAPHILGYELPQGLGIQPFLPEEVTYLCVLFAAGAFTIAIVRYRLLDVNLVINRSIVYSILTLFVVLSYLLLVGLGDLLALNLMGTGETFVRMAVVVVLAFLFAPARNLAQRAVDRLFFRSQLDQRQALVEFAGDLARTIHIRELSGRMTRLLDRALPTAWVQVYRIGDDEPVLQEVYGRPQDTASGPRVLSGEQIAALGLERQDEALPLEPDNPVLESVALMAPLRVDGRLVGAIALGAKRSGEPFHEDDLAFVNAVSNQAAVAFETARAFQTIQELNLRLEQKVLERTNQLAEAHQRLKDQYEKLRRLDELKEALTRMVVHDLKNPVGTLLMGLEVLGHGSVPELPREVRSTMDLIRQTVEQMQDLIANLLDLTRLEEGRLELVRQDTPLGELLERSLQRVRLVAEVQHIQLQVEADPALRPWIDAGLMTRVVVNLLTNALKFAPRESTVELCCGRVANGDPEGGGLWLSVTNAGPLIPEEFRERIFQKFFQVEQRHSSISGGVGLGLPFCKLVVEAHGGQIAMQSPPEGRADGARFTVRLPEVL